MLILTVGFSFPFIPSPVFSGFFDKDCVRQTPVFSGIVFGNPSGVIAEGLAVEFQEFNGGVPAEKQTFLS